MATNALAIPSRLMETRLTTRNGIRLAARPRKQQPTKPASKPAHVQALAKRAAELTAENAALKKQLAARVGQVVAELSAEEFRVKKLGNLAALAEHNAKSLSGGDSGQRHRSRRRRLRSKGLA